MTEIQKHAGDQLAIPAPHAAPASVIQISDWAAELGAARQLGNALAESGMIPDALRKEGKNYKAPEKLAADVGVVILAGKSIGLDPLTAVQNIFPVYGRPAMYARTMVGLAVGQGHEVERTHADQNSVTVRARRRGSREWHTFTWDMDRAKQAGYTGNALYQRDPIAMLTAKAQAEACRTMFADVLLGMPYSVEEGQLEDLGETVEEQPAATVKRKTRSKAKTTTKTETKPDPAPEPEPAEEPEPDLPGGVHDTAPITEQTWAEIHELAEQQNVGSVPGWASDQLGRTLTGWKDITEAEGDRLLQLLTTGETTQEN
ncbi:hypothetical protein [Nesterenkonia sp. PF2B19]|uniref:hypothetical protein n=1 Tax=Nesterenkonia sp. PF2B19 TaxID=1881858 RepID=UPI0008731A08|nr:hypothetical protein [Nesterenkonia sp. PF2B19]OSM43490.1 hypothetical protein BCY76_008200 [Nesterenkonia sp. PF2B19]